jgi:glycosyltransferase involved in cell wall biosynthesis
MTGVPSAGRGILAVDELKAMSPIRADANPHATDGLLCSVIIPARKLTPELAKIVTVLLRERERIREILVVVDGPASDADPAVVQAATAGNEPSGTDAEILRILSTGRRMGAGAARNLALEQAEGDVVLFLDSDALPVEGIVGQHLVCYADPETVGVGGLIELVGDSSLQLELTGKCSLLDSFYQAGRFESLWWNPTANLSMRRAEGGDLRFHCEFPKNGGGEDVLFGFQLKGRGRIAAQEGAVVKHPVWPGWLSAMRRFFRWGWAESILAWKVRTLADADASLVRREPTVVTATLTAGILVSPLVFMLSNPLLWLVPAGVFLGWEVAAVASAGRSSELRLLLGDRFFRLIFELGSFVGRLSPRGWRALNRRVLFFEDQVYKLWDDTLLCGRAGLLGGYLTLLLGLWLG